jgi:hypothetical protein
MTMPLKRTMTMLLLLTGIAWAGPKKKDVSMVQLTLRDGRQILGRIQSYRNGRYMVSQAGGKPIVVAATDLRTMVMAPETTVVIPKRNTAKHKLPTKQEIFKMALDELRNERKEDRRKRLEAAKGDMSQLGLGSILSKIGEDVQDNLLDFVAKDKELQNILMDDNVQKSVEEKDIMSLMKNEKILNMMRNPDKVKKLVGAVMGDEDEKNKKKSKKK